MAVNTFRGHDRRVLHSIQDAMTGIENRDAKALDTAKKTTAIKTRVTVISPLDTALVAQWNAVKARIAACLALTVS